MICDLWNRLLAGEERTWAVIAGAADSALLLTRHVRPHPQSRPVCLVNTLWFTFSLVFFLIQCLSGSGVVSLSLDWLGFIYKRCLEKCWPVSSPYDNRSVVQQHQNLIVSTHKKEYFLMVVELPKMVLWITQEVKLLLESPLQKKFSQIWKLVYKCFDVGSVQLITTSWILVESGGGPCWIFD